MIQINKEQLFHIQNPDHFEELALTIFKKQATENDIYQSYLAYLNVDPQSVKHINEIPFLPIEFFKSKAVLLRNQQAEIIFSSSGTTGMQSSKHYVSDVELYETSFRLGFNHFYGDVQNMAILALLPSYLERTGSSLIYMVDDLIKHAQSPYSGYFLYNHDELYKRLCTVQQTQVPTLLIGVTYALLDFIEKYPIAFEQLIVMETGGMKGKRTEMIREELHQKLAEGFGVKTIHSEYGMTELLSQAYSVGNGIFQCPPWMKVLIRDTNDPRTILHQQTTGGINVIDLANLNSCSFIATQDLGYQYADGSFEVLGRFDQSDIRGCNLLVQ